MKIFKLVFFIGLTFLFIGCDIRSDKNYEHDNIKNVIKTYFDEKYENLSTLTIKDLPESIVSSRGISPELSKEIEKRTDRVKFARENDYRYVKYKYFIEYDSIDIPPTSMKAKVVLRENHDVNFSSSPDITSSLYNLKHIIILVKESENWKIIDDQYQDEFRNSANEDEQLQANPIDFIPESQKEQMQLSKATGDWKQYSRRNATNYALKWANSRNPAYHDFSSSGGDCTNFVSQCIRAGGVHMDNTGKLHWYYFTRNHKYSISWINGTELYTYIDKNTWTGPYGYGTTSIKNITSGDIVQFSNGSKWFHTMIITGVKTYPSKEFFVCGHTNDRRHYPLKYLIGNSKLRYIKIQGYFSK